MDQKTKRTYRVTGFFVLVASISLLLLVIFIAFKQNAFTKKITYYTTLDNVVGITTSSPIIFKGYEIGRIKNYKLNKNNEIEVEFIVFQEFAHLMIEDSVLDKNVHPITGRGTLEFVMNRSSDKLIAEKSFVLSSDSNQGRKALQANQEHGSSEPISSLINKLERFVSNLGRDDNYDEGSFFRMIYNMAEVAEGLDKGIENLNRILISLQTEETKDDGVLFRTLNNFADLAEEMKITNSLLANNLVKLNSLLENYEHPEGLLSKMLDPTGMDIIQPLSESLLLLQKSLREISELMEFANDHAPELLLLMSESKKTLNEIQKTVEGINSNPLIRGGITKPDTPVPGSKIRVE
ncbi:MAG: MlaD family protein [Candidatus Cloacimonas sp.]|nr:MlaD family protein [Candidatus Cloacimonadota bacterium]